MRNVKTGLLAGLMAVTAMVAVGCSNDKDDNRRGRGPARASDNMRDRDRDGMRDGLEDRDRDGVRDGEENGGRNRRKNPDMYR